MTFSVLTCYNITTVKQRTKCLLNKTADVGKEKIMEEMTDLQFKTLINAIIQIIKDNDNKDDMIKKIEALVNKN